MFVDCIVYNVGAHVLPSVQTKLVRSISKENAPFFFAADGSQQGEACLLEGGFEEIGMSSWTSECLASNYGISSGHPNV